MREFEVIEGPGERALVRADARLFCVPAPLARELARAGGLGAARWRELVGPPRRRRPASPLWLRVTVVPAPAVNRAARRLAPLAATGCLAALAAGGAAAAGVLVTAERALAAPSAGRLAAAVALFLLSALWHECGHAAALRREGLPSGSIGAGVLWVMPVLTCDVSAVALLPGRGRIRVDLAGMAFQLAAAGALALAAAATGAAACALAAAAAYAAVLWSGVPLLRTDAHWTLLDLLGLADLDAPPPASGADGGPRARLAALALWRAATIAALVALAAWLPWRLAAAWRWVRAADWPGPLLAGAAALLAAVAVAGGWSLARRVAVLARALARDLSLAPGRGRAMLSGASPRGRRHGPAGGP